jgi:CRP-like cAMP-binding protein
MRNPQLLELLKSIPFLREVDEDVLLILAAKLERQEFAKDDVILLQGSRADSMYFIAEGSVDIVLMHPDQPERHLDRLVSGDTFGEIEMIFPQARIAAVRASQPATVYRWDREAMKEFMQTRPSVLASLRFSAQSRRLAYKLRFNWLAEAEVVYGLARKHSAILYQSLTLPLIILTAAALLTLWGLTGKGLLVTWIGSGIGLAGLAFLVWRWVDWRNDYYLVTDRRVVWLEKVVGIFDSRSEAPLHTVLSVSVSTDVLGRLLGYGDVVIRTYTSRVIFHNVGNPKAMAAIIEEHWRRACSTQDETDRESLRQIVRNRLESDQSNQESVEHQTIIEAPLESEQPAIGGGFPGFNFKVRFKDKDVITYRKHWAVLLREIGAPSALFLLVAGLIGARIVGMLHLLTLPTFLTLAGLTLVLLSAWWLYRYADWANDIYQITPDQIVDVYKKPLAREERKVAPLENILGTEVDRKGIFGILLNYGDVIANVGTAQFTFEGIFDPVNVQQDIVNAQQALFERKKDKERRQRRDEMVELIDIYHDEFAPKERGKPKEAKE